MKVKWGILFGLIFFFHGIGAASAAPVPVANSSFEIPSLFDGGWDFDIDFWDESNDTTNVSVTSSWNSTTTYLNEPLPDGTHVGSIFRVGWIAQSLPVTLASSTRYTLQVSVGRLITNGHPEGFIGLGVASPPSADQYVWSGDVLASYDLSNLSLAQGEFGLATVTYQAPAGSTDIGEDLWIYLVNTAEHTRVQIAFDDVRLDATAVPVPGAMWLLGTGFVSLVMFRRKMK